MPIKYGLTLDKFALGRRTNMEEWNTITRTQESATALGFGVPVQRGTGEHGCVIYTNGAFLGVSEASQVQPHVGDNFAQYENVPVCEVGCIGVRCAGTVTAGMKAGWDASANGGAGAWVEADTGSPQIPGCEFDTGGTDTVVALRVRRRVP